MTLYSRMLKNPPPLLFALILLTISYRQLWAQEMAPWQAAETIRQQLFQAQTEMFAAARADNPQIHYKTAATLVEQAATLYTGTIQPELAAVSTGAGQAISESFAQAQAAASQGQALQFAAARGRLWPNLLRGSYQATLAAIEAGDVESAAAWLQLREYRPATKVTVVDDVSTQTLAALKAGDIETGQAQAAIGGDLRDAYFFRLREALNSAEENIEKEFTVRAAEWAGQARGYFDILRTDIEQKQGPDSARSLAAGLAALEQAVISRDDAAAMTHLAAVRDGLAGYAPVELDAAEVDKRGQLLYLFTRPFLKSCVR